MDEVRKSYVDLKKACSAQKKGKNRKSLATVLNTFESHFHRFVSHIAHRSRKDSLNYVQDSSSLSASDAEILVKQFRGPLSSVYALSPKVCLQFVGSLAEFIYQNKILTEYTSGKVEQKLKWEQLLNALLSGVLVSLREYFSGCQHMNVLEQDYHDEYEGSK